MPALRTLIGEVSGQPGVHAALLTGSGSTVFGLCANARAAARAAAHFKERGYWSCACTTALPCQTQAAVLPIMGGGIQQD
jgi:4-diphosphocytidyl-2C-methyl-D-erythritol kinase